MKEKIEERKKSKNQREIDGSKGKKGKIWREGFLRARGGGGMVFGPRDTWTPVRNP